MDPLGGVRSTLAQGKASQKGVKNKLKMAKAANAKSAKFNKPVMMHVLLFMLMGILLGLTVMIPIFGRVEYSVVRILFISIAIVSLALGIWHNERLFKKIDWAHPFRFWPEFGLTAGTALLFGLAIFLMYFFLPGLNHLWEDAGNFAFIFSTASLAFVIPFLFMHVFKSAEQVEEKNYHLWYYPKNYVERQPTWNFEKLIYANMIFRPKENDEKKVRIEVRLPLEANFGEVIYLFIDDYNQNKSPDRPIENLNAADNSQGWLFSASKKIGKIKYGTRFLDPELTVEENKITKQLDITFHRKMREADHE